MERTRRDWIGQGVQVDCEKHLRVRTGVRVTWCWYVASHERAIAVEQERLHEEFREKK